MKRNLIQALLLSAALIAGIQPVEAQPASGGQAAITWDSRSLFVDGRRVLPVMGEVHYSRIPEDEWAAEVKKMKEGGVTIIATYVFWNHIEEVENQFDWSGQRNLRRFLEVCKQQQMPVVLRLGPFCHGEVRNGGIPDWFFTKGIRSRSEDPRFLALAQKFYRQIFTQVQGLQWKDGGPVVACQFDNEYRGRGSYLVALKKIALGVGFDLPFYTRTGWPDLATPVPYGEMIPLYGDYADGFWERSTKPTAGNYFKAFFFKPSRDNKSIATEQIKYTDDKAADRSEAYPYFTCELGSGMMTAYHRRPYMYDNDAYAMAVVKLGSGSNLLGYYMYHGGTNPEGRLTYLNENQRTQATNYNDLPVKTYDFQAPLGEFGQRHSVYYRLRPLHLFAQDFGELLAPMDARFVSTHEPVKGDDSYLRQTIRTADGKSGFVFFNNYERLQKLSPKRGVRFELGGTRFPSRAVTIPADAIGVLPVHVAGIKYATAQLVAQREGKVYLMQISGLPTELAFEGGPTLKNVKARGTAKAVYKNYYLLTEKEAERLFLPDSGEVSTVTKAEYAKVKEAGPPRTITLGQAKVAEEPSDSDFLQAAVYTIAVPDSCQGLLDIDYHGDCARLYANGKLIGDNFYNGRHFQYGLWRLPAGTSHLELRILPLQPSAPVYLPAEADATPGEGVKAVTIITPAP